MSKISRGGKELSKQINFSVCFITERQVAIQLFPKAIHVLQKKDSKCTQTGGELWLPIQPNTKLLNEYWAIQL